MRRIDLIKISREEENESAWVYIWILEEKELTTEARSERKEDEIMKTMHASDVDGLVDLTDIKEQ